MADLAQCPSPSANTSCAEPSQPCLLRGTVSLLDDDIARVQSLRQCAQLCAACPSCQYVSYSRDCCSCHERCGMYRHDPSSTTLQVWNRSELHAIGTAPIPLSEHTRQRVASIDAAIRQLPVRIAYVSIGQLRGYQFTLPNQLSALSSIRQPSILDLFYLGPRDQWYEAAAPFLKSTSGFKGERSYLPTPVYGRWAGAPSMFLNRTVGKMGPRHAVLCVNQLLIGATDGPGHRSQLSVAIQEMQRREALAFLQEYDDYHFTFLVRTDVFVMDDISIQIRNALLTNYSFEDPSGFLELQSAAEVRPLEGFEVHLPLPIGILRYNAPRMCGYLWSENLMWCTCAESSFCRDAIASVHRRCSHRNVTFVNRVDLASVGGAPGCPHPNSVGDVMDHPENRAFMW
mmetsp:Transcript_15537/g.40156  ORF Transcript_15537/g.40156 Transcript_15537/m.40156 type:complete len:400 (-) Transcript_15537:337-1536(-)